MACTTPQDTSTAEQPADEWLSLADARAILDVVSEDVVRYWAQRGLLRARTPPNGELQVSREDVLFRKEEREALSAIGGDELTEEELETLRKARPGKLPWERDHAAPGA